MNQFHYSMIIQWDSRDNIFVVRVPELPGCVTHGNTYEEAVKQGKDAIESWISSAIADSEPIPAPRNYANTAA
jgi:predicted RNase H-like HicB family nuclease